MIEGDGGDGVKEGMRGEGVMCVVRGQIMIGCLDNTSYINSSFIGPICFVTAQ